MGNAAVCFVELAFEADDSRGGRQGHVLVEQFPHSDGKGEVGAAVAALPACRAAWGQQPGGVEATEEGGLDTE